MRGANYALHISNPHLDFKMFRRAKNSSTYLRKIQQIFQQFCVKTTYDFRQSVKCSAVD